MRGEGLGVYEGGCACTLHLDISKRKVPMQWSSSHYGI